MADGKKIGGVQIRAEREVFDAWDAAAKARGQTRAQFVRWAADKAAAETLTPTPPTAAA